MRPSMTARRPSRPEFQNLPVRPRLMHHAAHSRMLASVDYREVEERILDDLDYEVADMLGLLPTQ